MTLITEPGLYQDFDEREYHADPCPEPSASRSIIKLIAERSPAHAFVAHPRLNPEQKEESDWKFDIGTAFHSAVLSRGKKVQIIAGFDDWKKGDARLLRDKARAEGCVPLLESQAERVTKMCAAVTRQLPGHGLAHLFKEELGRGEVVAAWKDPVAGWSRALIDWLEADLTITDLKATEMELGDDEAIGRHMSNMGYEVQHAWYERGIVALYPELEGRVKFRFLFCEVKEPFAIMPYTLPADAIAKGRATVARGVERWAQAKASGEWPPFTGGDRTAVYPPWSTAEWAT